MPHYFYLARCADKTLYAGYTNNIEQREKKHNAGTGAKYTAGRRPVKIVYWEKFNSQKEALRREWEVKKMSRVKKETLIKKHALK